MRRALAALPTTSGATAYSLSSTRTSASVVLADDDKAMFVMTQTRLVCVSACGEESLSSLF